MRVKWNSLDAHSFTGVDDEIAAFCPGHTHQPLHLDIVLMERLSLGFPSTSSIKKLLSEHASRGVTKYLVSGHLTSERPNGSEHPGSITLPSGEAPKYGASMLITSLHWLVNRGHIFLVLF